MKISRPSSGANGRAGAISIGRLTVGGILNGGCGLAILVGCTRMTGLSVVVVVGAAVVLAGISTAGTSGLGWKELPGWLRGRSLTISTDGIRLIGLSIGLCGAGLGL